MRKKEKFQAINDKVLCLKCGSFMQIENISVVSSVVSEEVPKKLFIKWNCPECGRRLEEIYIRHEVCYLDFKFPS